MTKARYRDLWLISVPLTCFYFKNWSIKKSNLETDIHKQAVFVFQPHDINTGRRLHVRAGCPRIFQHARQMYRQLRGWWRARAWFYYFKSVRRGSSGCRHQFYWEQTSRALAPTVWHHTVKRSSFYTPARSIEKERRRIRERSRDFWKI